jgi:N6-L-threonylcarbamoyladenine synthase
MSDVRIRRLEARDLPQVLAIEQACFTTPWSALAFEDELEGERRSWYVAESPEGVLGYAGMRAVHDTGHILNLAVRRDVQRRGLGTALLARLMRDAVLLGLARVTLEVRDGNVAGRSLYERAGFAAEGARPGYYADTGEDAIVMWTGRLDDEEGRALVTSLIEAGERALEESGSSRQEPDLILALETSCDETAAAIVRGGREVLSSIVASQVDFHRRFGGVVPEIASRKHIEAIVGVVDEALEEAGVDFSELTALAVTHGPGLVGALVVGVAYAKGLAYATGLPLVGVNHLEGHLFANVLSDPTVRPPFVALVVSGGHTSLVHVPEWGVYETLGQTLDDAAGEAFDKVAKVLGLGYPGGPAISRLAEQGDPGEIDFPRAMLHSSDYAFSLSGLKTAVVTYVRGEEEAGRDVDAADVAASFQQAVVDVQVAKAVRAAVEKRVDLFCLAGGVAANARLREGLDTALGDAGIRLSVPPFELCTDNAAMIGAAAHYRLARGDLLDLDAEAVPDLRL